MSITDLTIAMAAAGLGASLADWLFLGVLFHDKYLVHPEVWRRPRGGPGETRAVAISALISLATPIGFVALCAILGVSGRNALVLATGTWAIAALPMLLVQHLFVRLDTHVTVAHSLGWLVKLLISAAAVSWRF